VGKEEREEGKRMEEERRSKKGIGGIKKRCRVRRKHKKEREEKKRRSREGRERG
jgi:hypothetical protein